MLKTMMVHGLAVVLAVAAMVGIAEARSLDDIIKEGTIRIGINPNFPPMSSRNAPANGKASTSRSATSSPRR